MSSTNPIQILQQYLESRGVVSLITSPVSPTGTWTLDVRHNERWVVVTWQDPSTFSVSLNTEETLYGDGPDRLFYDYEQTLDRTLELLAKSKGLKVLSLLPNSHAAHAGIQVGDLVLEVDGQAINSVDDYFNVVANRHLSMSCLIERAGQLLTFEVAVSPWQPDGPN